MSNSSRLAAAALCGLLAAGPLAAAAQTARPAAPAQKGGDVSRSFTWTGGEEISFSVPSDIRYRQGPAADIVVSGPRELVDRVELRRGEFRFDRRMRNVRDRLDIVVTLPNIKSFGLSGSQRLDIAGYDQPALTVGLSGSGRVTAAGATRSSRISISGSGDVDLARLSAMDTTISISGSGSVVAGPKESARISISGSGNVDLLTNPPQMQSSVSGSGRVRVGRG